jgi:hypothetical protein
MQESLTRIRYSTASLLWFMTWSGLWVAAWARLAVVLDPDNPGWMTRIQIEGAFWWFVICVSPFAVFGMIVGRRWSGVAFGALMSVLYVCGVTFMAWMMEHR